MAYTNGESDRNTERYDAPSDGPDGYREDDRESAERQKREFPEFDYCIKCNLYPVQRGSDYCGDICAIDAENDR